MPGSDPVTLEVGIGDSDKIQYFRSLKWFVNSVEISSNGKYLISQDDRSLTINDTVEQDAGVYEVKFTGLLRKGYEEKCRADSEVLDLLSSYPIASPVTFQLVKQGELKFCDSLLAFLIHYSSYIPLVLYSDLSDP